MRMRVRILPLLGLALLCSNQTGLAYSVKFNDPSSQFPITTNPVEERAYKEEKIPLKYIAIAFHRPNYILPFYYTGSPYNSVYANHTPYDEQIKSAEVKYQVSLKVPLWKDIFDYNSSLYFAYTLLTYWQVYNKNAFIRETDYEPEAFFRNTLNYPIYKCWDLNFFNYGYSHQSNGWGNSLQRGWDRIYIEAITSVNNWMISFKPWFVIARNGNNTDITNYLGYANFTAAYKFHDQVFALQVTNLGATPYRTSANLTWSFPLTAYIKGYAEVFSGYGQSLIEYNHRTNSAGIGFAVSDWV